MLRTSSCGCKTSSVVRKVLKGILIGVCSGIVFKITIDIVVEIPRGYCLGCTFPGQLLHCPTVYSLLVQRQIPLAILLTSFVSIEILGRSDGCVEVGIPRSWHLGVRDDAYYIRFI